MVWEYICENCTACGDVHCGGGDGGGHYEAYLVLGKARVTPLRGYTVPRSEMSAGVLVSRMVLRVVRALQGLDGPPFSSIIMLDSTCTISTLEASSKILKPFFHNRRGELMENLENIAKYCKVEPVHWIGSENNVADLLT